MSYDKFAPMPSQLALPGEATCCLCQNKMAVYPIALCWDHFHRLTPEAQKEMEAMQMKILNLTSSLQMMDWLQQGLAWETSGPRAYLPYKKEKPSSPSKPATQKKKRAS